MIMTDTMNPDLYYFCRSQTNEDTGNLELVPVSDGYDSEIDALRALRNRDLFRIVAEQKVFIYLDGQRVRPSEASRKFVLAETRKLRNAQPGISQST